MPAKIFKEVIANDLVNTLEAFADSSLLVFGGSWKKGGGRSNWGGRSGGHVEKGRKVIGKGK